MFVCICMYIYIYIYMYIRVLFTNSFFLLFPRYILPVLYLVFAFVCNNVFLFFYFFFIACFTDPKIIENIFNDYFNIIAEKNQG